MKLSIRVPLLYCSGCFNNISGNNRFRKLACNKKHGSIGYQRNGW